MILLMFINLPWKDFVCVYIYNILEMLLNTYKGNFLENISINLRKCKTNRREGFVFRKGSPSGLLSAENEKVFFAFS